MIIFLKPMKIRHYRGFNTRDVAIKTKIKTYKHKIYVNFLVLKIAENDTKSKSFAVFSINCLLAYENIYYLQVYLDSCAYKIIKKGRINCLDDNLFETDEN